jgi:hypothetical protein
MAIDSTTNSTLLNTIEILKKNINPNSGLYVGKLGKILKVYYDKVEVLFEGRYLDMFKFSL